MNKHRLGVRKDRKRERNVRAHVRRLNRNAPICPHCGMQETWCTICQVYSQDCCEDYGTCLCS